MTDSDRLNIATAIERALRCATFTQNMTERDFEIRNEQRRQRERNSRACGS